MTTKRLTFITAILSLSFLFSCTETSKPKIVSTAINPAAAGFNAEASDQKAIDLADKCMLAMGGRAAYDQTRYLSWNFFGSRKHVWDKETGNVYIKNLKEDYELHMNINDLTGKMILAGDEVVNQDTLSKYLAKGKDMWINDAYWLVMPYKLKDPGVILKYLGEATTNEGAAAEKIEMTFDNVGKTPENKYYVYIDNETNFVTQWDYFDKATDPEPWFSRPWEGYKNYDGIMLSGGRGKSSLTDIDVSESLKSYFE